MDDDDIERPREADLGAETCGPFCNCTPSDHEADWIPEPEYYSPGAASGRWRDGPHLHARWLAGVTKAIGRRRVPPLVTVLARGVDPLVLAPAAAICAAWTTFWRHAFASNGLVDWATGRHVAKATRRAQVVSARYRGLTAAREAGELTWDDVIDEQLRIREVITPKPLWYQLCWLTWSLQYELAGLREAMRHALGLRSLRRFWRVSADGEYCCPDCDFERRGIDGPFGGEARFVPVAQISDAEFDQPGAGRCAHCDRGPDRRALAIAGAL